MFTQVLKEKFLIDFTEYASTYLRMRLENFMSKWNVSSLDSLLIRMQDNDILLNRLIEALSVETTEMFRDPSLWRKLYATYLPKINSSQINIWLPDITSDDELYTLLVVLDRLNLLDKTYILATSAYKVNLDRTKTGEISMKKYEVSNDNYKRYMQDNEASLDKYFVFSDNKAYFSQELIERVNYAVLDVLVRMPDRTFDLVLFRNRMLYYSLNLQNKILERIYPAIAKKRYLIVGFKENISRFAFSDHFKFDDKEDKIYKRVK